MRVPLILAAICFSAGAYAMPAASQGQQYAQADQNAPPPGYNGPPTSPPPGYQGPPSGYNGPPTSPPPGYSGPGSGDAGPPSAPPPSAGGHGAGHMKGKARFEAANTTNDGRLTLAQAQAAHWGGIVRHFPQIDRDQKGYVTWQDIRDFHKEMHAAKLQQQQTPPPSAANPPPAGDGPHY